MTRALVTSLIVALLTAGTGLAQTPPAEASAAPASPVPAPPAVVPGKTADTLEPQGFTYDPQGRRDPFVSLMRRGADTTQTGRRGAGLAGLSTAEVSLRGTLVSQGAFVGIVQGVDARTYIVRAGDKLADGSIRSISANEMVVLQQINDPLSLQKEREVRKMLRQTEEGK